MDITRSKNLIYWMVTYSFPLQILTSLEIYISDNNYQDHNEYHYHVVAL